jgi:2-polyprenyl-3-methyl-5-hydroxy-6-metoxy-1,4-benzoquinol methylase
MIENKIKNCPICGSNSLTKFNSYKHMCYACSDCNSIHHEKKSGRYLLEWLLPVNFISKILPRQVVLRLFHASIEKFDPSEFYDGYKEQSLSPSPVKISQTEQIEDILELNNINLKNLNILDISGGPGVVASKFKDKCKRIIVSEFSDISVKAMRENLNVEAIKFDYSKDKIENIVDSKFDVVMVRSSVIFCEDLDGFIQSLSKILNPGGYVLIQTIVPTLGEVFWWQQMEFKFPVIYSQMVIEKLFYRNGFNLIYGYREYGDYVSIKKRSVGIYGFLGHLFTWLIEYPMVLIYYFFTRKSKIPIDQSLKHKFLTQLWRKDNIEKLILKLPKIENYNNKSQSHQSPDFYQSYNGFLKNNIKK